MTDMIEVVATDRGAKRRLDDLIAKSYRSVVNKSRVSRTKGSLRSFYHTHHVTAGNTAPRVFKMGTSVFIAAIVVPALVAGVGFGGAALLGAVITGLSAYAIKRMASSAIHSNLKATVKERAKKTATEDGYNFKNAAPTLETNEDDRSEAPAFLQSLIYDISALEVDKRAVGLNPQAFAKLSGKTTQLDLATRTNVKFERFRKVKSLRGEERVVHRLSRLRFYLRWLVEYLSIEEQIASEFLAQAQSVEGDILGAVQIQVSLAGNHEACKQDLCFGPDRDDIQFVTRSPSGAGAQPPPIPPKPGSRVPPPIPPKPGGAPDLAGLGRGLGIDASKFDQLYVKSVTYKEIFDLTDADAAAGATTGLLDGLIDSAGADGLGTFTDKAVRSDFESKDDDLAFMADAAYAGAGAAAVANSISSWRKSGKTPQDKKNLVLDIAGHIENGLIDVAKASMEGKSESSKNAAMAYVGCMKGFTAAVIALAKAPEGEVKKARLGAAIAATDALVAAGKGRLAGLAGDAAKGAVQGASKTASAGALAAGASAGAVVGEAIDIAWGLAKESIEVNRPLMHSASAVGKLMQDAEPVGLDEQVRAEFDKHSAKALSRALEKVMHHYPERMADRADKLERAMRLMKDTSRPSTYGHCGQAVDSIRYLAKLYRYVDKQLTHIFFLKYSIEELDRKIFRKSVMLNKKSVMAEIRGAKLGNLKPVSRAPRPRR